MSNKTKVIFRRARGEGEVIAIFPELPGDDNPYRTCLSYVHFGQHGAIGADYTEWTVPVSLATYAPLMAELQSIGYDLKVCKRANYKDLQARIKACGYYQMED